MLEYILLCCFSIVMLCVLITINDNSIINKLTIFVLSIPILPILLLLWVVAKLFEVEGD